MKESKMESKQTAIIIGAGPAGLTAALELIRHTSIKPIVLEVLDDVGGISRTVNHHGNRMDIGGHRFFSKSDWVMNWWREILPLENNNEAQIEISYQNSKRTIEVTQENTGESSEKRMLIRSRLSRIYFLRKFFDYPVKLNLNTINNLGLVRLVEIALSYIHIRLFPRKPEKKS